MNEFEQLTKLCRGLGATGQQAEVMARQLSKRVDQLVVERAQSREEAMTYLLRIVVQGHTGEVPPEFSSNQPETDQNKSENSAK